MSDNDWNNNWIEREGIPDFKNAYIKNDNRDFRMEVIDRFSLERVGLPQKGEIKWDVTNT